MATTRTPPHPWLAVTIIGVLIVVVAVGIFVIGLVLAFLGKKAVETKKADDIKKVAAYAGAYPPTPTREALVLMHECTTPCNAFMGYGYKWIADGPARAKYHGSNQWVGEGSPTGKAEDPIDFEPGMAQFESMEGMNVGTLVHIYKKERR